MLLYTFYSYELGSDGTLVIKNAAATDSGVFQCFATNVAGQIMAATWIQMSSEFNYITNSVELSDYTSGFVSCIADTDMMGLFIMEFLLVFIYSD